MAEPTVVEIFTDGSCRGNPGPGGWGTILRWRGVEKELSGGEPDTTNNRMELMAVIQGLRAMRRRSVIIVHTDSQYVQKGMSQWLDGWKAKDFRVKGGGFRKNHDLWRELDALASKHEMHWQWIKGHAGHPENERADKLAREGSKNADG